MFSIESVALQGFKSFAEPQCFVLPKQPGLYFVTGLNKQHPRLGANATGKSTLLDAIYWCLFGHTSRGLKAGDVVTRGGKSASVEVRLNINGAYIAVLRKQAPNSLHIGEGGKWRPVDQDAVDKALGLNAEAFQASVMRAQFGESFLQLKPAEKLTLFSQIMGLDLWLEKSRKAADLAKELEGEGQIIEQKVAKFTGQIEATTEDIKELKIKESTHADQNKAEIRNQRALIEKADGKIVEILKKIEINENLKKL